MAEKRLTGFQLNSDNPLDSRLVYPTKSAMFGEVDGRLYDGILATYKGSEKVTYQWWSTNESLANIGRWRVFKVEGAAQLFVLCKTLPTQPAEGNEKCIHVAPTSGNAGTWSQYLWEEGTNGAYAWTNLGVINITLNIDDVLTSDDLEGYYTKAEINTMIGNINTNLATLSAKVGDFADFVSGFNSGLEGGSSNPSYTNTSDLSAYITLE